MAQGRRQFTDEFKREAVALLASSGRPLIQIASELGIAPSMLRNWRNRGGGRKAGPALPPIPAAVPPSAPDPAAEISLYRSHAAWPVRIINWPGGPTRWELPEISCASST
jgi:transposase